MHEECTVQCTHAVPEGCAIPQVKERLLKILSFWSDRKLYDKDTMQQLEAALLSGDPNAMLQAPAPKQVCGNSLGQDSPSTAQGKKALSNTAVSVLSHLCTSICSLPINLCISPAYLFFTAYNI